MRVRRACVGVWSLPMRGIAVASTSAEAGRSTGQYCARVLRLRFHTKLRVLYSYASYGFLVSIELAQLRGRDQREA